MQGERILKLAEMCRKLETEEEKVVPFYSNSLSAEEEETVASAEEEPPSEPLAKVEAEWLGSLYLEIFVIILFPFGRLCTSILHCKISGSATTKFSWTNYHWTERNIFCRMKIQS